ncbi:MAG: hypothetical protein KKH01_03650, partial [Firmicutes bacterium]|nr:hypothetical protein [Bacillota bacterium]
LYTIKEYSFDQLYSQLTGVFEYREKDYTSAKEKLELAKSNAYSKVEKDFYKNIIRDKTLCIDKTRKYGENKCG